MSSYVDETPRKSYPSGAHPTKNARRSGSLITRKDTL